MSLLYIFKFINWKQVKFYIIVQKQEELSFNQKLIKFRKYSGVIISIIWQTKSKKDRTFDRAVSSKVMKEGFDVFELIVWRKKVEIMGTITQSRFCAGITFCAHYARPTVNFRWIFKTFRLHGALYSFHKCTFSTSLSLFWLEKGWPIFTGGGLWPGMKQCPETHTSVFVSGVKKCYFFGKMLNTF